MKILLVGVLSALFFSSTFILNRAMSLEGGHWVWSASFRYGWMVLFLMGGMLVARPSLLRETLKLYLRHWGFWTLAGSVGFGVFYAMITFSASHTPGWVVAATWQTTILATPLVLLLFRRTVPLRAMALTAMVFAGVVLVNMEQATLGGWNEILLGALPVLGAAFAYPLGNQMVWEAEQGNSGFIPRIHSPAMANAFAKVLLLTLGSVPFWAVVILVASPPPPAADQVLNTALVAVFSGVAATSLFLYARRLARNAAELSAVDCTQSMEVVFSLAGEMLLLGGALPGLMGWGGLVLTMLGLVLYIRVQNVR